ncbi:hypothetical protein BAUCODRAFT_150470 [Baudoinia panamericana UAMH 10762]|uniref:Exonuclease domain-containing protein n=1 Tax=Baudoinia panamericana (strain UAMH 10762) TaxID=717646 RepID=M2N5G3_BAUPA|nr:uncharacterized protein BAUCODRAFT_150470 [Baudoinia panamericana UAMH 10762]EMC94284.1 hypothetical protein BAUCODRAFT_150470 [Baudoinia panamericana UAMH 10762]
MPVIVVKAVDLEVSAKQSTSQLTTPGRATQTSPLYHKLIKGEPVFLDIEFQKYKIDGELKQKHRIGRVTCLNTAGETVLDADAIYPREANIKKCWQPAEFGVTAQGLLFENGGVAAHKVEGWVANIVKNRTVVVHGGTHDLTSFYYKGYDVWTKSTMVDTQDIYSGLRGRSRPGLDICASVELGISLRKGGEHCPVEDADATRRLYLKAYPYDRRVEVEKQKENNKGHEGTKTDRGSKAAGTIAGKGPQHTGNVSGSAKKRARNRAARAALAVEQPIEKE